MRQADSAEAKAGVGTGLLWGWHAGGVFSGTEE